MQHNSENRVIKQQKTASGTEVASYAVEFPTDAAVASGMGVASYAGEFPTDACAVNISHVLRDCQAQGLYAAASVLAERRDLMRSGALQIAGAD